MGRETRKKSAPAAVCVVHRPRPAPRVCDIVALVPVATRVEDVGVTIGNSVDPSAVEAAKVSA